MRLASVRALRGVTSASVDAGGGLVCTPEPDGEAPWASETARALGAEVSRAFSPSTGSPLAWTSPAHSSSNEFKGGLHGLYHGCNPLKL